MILRMDLNGKINFQKTGIKAQDVLPGLENLQTLLESAIPNSTILLRPWILLPDSNIQSIDIIQKMGKLNTFFVGKTY